MAILSEFNQILIVMKTRIKTKQEFIAEDENWAGLRPHNWALPQMDYLYGLPAEAQSIRSIHSDLTDGDPDWMISDYHLTTAPHPYKDRQWKVRVKDQKEWDKIDARCKVLGINWTAEASPGRCEYDNQPGMFIRRGILSTASGTPGGRKYFNDEALPELTFEQFMEGYDPTAEEKESEKLDAYIRNNTLRIWTGGPGMKIIGSTDTAYQYNLMSEEDFKKKHTPELKFKGYFVRVENGELHIGCKAYALGNVKLIEAVLRDMEGEGITVDDALHFIARYHRQFKD